jgi:hypothetical protein
LDGDGVSSDLEWIADWFARHCDGEWEHGQGITVETLDNPGWAVKIWLTGTELGGRPFAEIDDRFRSDDDWLHCRVNGEFFEGFGGPRNLFEILRAFRAWASEE